MKTKKKVLKITGIVLLALLALFCIASPIVVQALMNDTFARTEPPEAGLTSSILYEDIADRYDREPVSFLSGENRLTGHLYCGDNAGGLVVIAHGLGGGEGSYLPEMMWFADHGYQVLCYSNTGCWDSEGKNCIGLNQSVLDLDAALTWVEGESRFDGLPVFLFGHSWGGYAAAAIFHFDHDITASASVAGFNEAMPMIMEWGKGMVGPLIYLEYPFIWLNQKLTFGGTFGLTAVDAINSTDTPILILHGSGDATVGYDTVSIIAKKDEITNPNVRYLVCSEDRRDGHNNLLYSPAAMDYVDEVNETGSRLDEQYDGDVPEEVLRDYYASIDKSREWELDPGVMGSILTLYREAVK